MLLPEHVYNTLVSVCDTYPWPVVEDDYHLGEILNEVAWTHRSEGWGLSRKTGGRHVKSPVGLIAEDILQLRDGNHFDVLQAASKGNPLKPVRVSSIGIIAPDRPWVAPVNNKLSWMTTPQQPPTQPLPSPEVPGSTQVVAMLADISKQLVDVNNRLARLEAQPSGTDLSEYVDMMVGAGPGEGAPNHITDIKVRIDRATELAQAIMNKLNASKLLRY
jgi:hypothetical protein